MKHFIKNIKIRTKLLAAFMFAAVMVLIIVLSALFDMQNSVGKTGELHSMIIIPLDHLSRTTMEMGNLKIEGRNALLDKNPASRNQTIQKASQMIVETKELMVQYESTILSNQAWVPYAALLERLDEYADLWNGFSSLLRAERTDEAQTYLEETLSPVSEACIEYLSELTAIKLGNGEKLASDAIDRTRASLVWLVILFILGLLITIVFGIYFSITISSPIMKGADLMMRAAGGDLTVRLPTKYGAEIGQLFAACNLLNTYNDTSITNLKEAIMKMRESAQNMLAISSLMAANSKGLNEQTAFVSATTEEFSAAMTQSSSSLSTASAHISAVASSIEEINSTISTVAAAAEETSTRVEQSSALVDSIQNSISKASGSVTLASNAFTSVAESVNDINKSISVVSEHSVAARNKMADADDKAKNTNSIIQRLEAASKQIGKIVSVISDIADQTNMLALNAAIEAAGAGEAGKGFMVVANEVKELAKQTADATDEIADQIENMQRNMPAAVGAVLEITAIINGMTEFMNSFAQEITQQGKRSDQIAEESAAAARRMNEISTEINRISENALSVTNTVIDSSKGVNEIAKSTAELVVGTNEIAMNSERASNNISEINRAAKEMVTGLIDISKNTQLINEEAGTVQQSADSAKLLSEELLKVASDLEEFISKFKNS